MTKPRVQPSQLGAALENQRRLKNKKGPSGEKNKKVTTTPTVSPEPTQIPESPYKNKGNIRFVSDVFSHPALQESAEVRALLEALVGGVNSADDHHAGQLLLNEELAADFLRRAQHWIAEDNMQACSVTIQVPQARVDANDASFSMENVRLFRRGIRGISRNGAWQPVPSLEVTGGHLRVIYALEGFVFDQSLHETIDARVREMSIRLTSADAPGAIRVAKLETAGAIRLAINSMFCIMIRHLPKERDPVKRSVHAMRLMQIRSLIETKQLTALDTGEGKEVMRAALAKTRKMLPERKLAVLSAAPKARRGRDIAMLQRLTGFGEAEIPYLKR